MKANSKLRSISAEMDELFGKEGTAEREAFPREAYAYYTGQIETEYLNVVGIF